jgi:endonuclease G
MGAVNDHLKEARNAALLAAANRWKDRASIREENLAKIVRNGVGAGDTPKRRQEYSVREQSKQLNKVLVNERVIGPSTDFSPFAPSQLATKAAQPVARIVTLPDGDREPAGIATGFLLPGNLLMTNYHVFQTASGTSGYGANFNYYTDDRGINRGVYFEFDAGRFFIADADFDFAIVAVKPKGLKGEALADQGQIRLIEATGKILTGLPLNIVQHPAGGTRQFAFTNNLLLDILPTGFLHYETDTDKGSSGSPVSNIDWELVGLHHCGVPLVRDGQIMTVHETAWNPDEPESLIKWVANECARVSSIVARLRALRADNPAQQAVLSALLATTSDPVAAVAAASATRPASALEIASLNAAGGSMQSPVFSFSGPVTINVYPAAAPSSSTALALQPDGFSSEEKTLLFDSAYNKRPGYDPHFLGIDVPLPTVDKERYGELYSGADYLEYYEGYRNVPKLDTVDPLEPVILPYHHYSLVLNKKYHMCQWTASNCDYRALERQDQRRRAELGGENWRFDPRVPERYQLGNSDVYGPAKRIDRGHIVRREDNAWGQQGLPTDYANADTYHWTNCTPQHEAFNQENPKDNNPKKTNIYQGLGWKGIWGQFEGRLATALEKGGSQATIFAGPILDDHFPETDWGTGKVAIPRKFWKVFIIPESASRHTRLLVYSYIFDQAPAVRKFDLSYEGIELPDFERNHTTLAKISALTGVLFAPVLIEAEALTA